MCKVSIIVAVYQGELYIKECLESLLLQDLDDYEIICINDGSTDYTEMIILEMQKSFSKIRYIYQKNSGVSVARNKGLEQAAGDYVMFVDADDYLKNNSLKFLYETIIDSNADILVFGGRTDCPFKTPEWIRYAFYTRNRIYEYFTPEILFNENGTRPSVCNKCFRKETIGNNMFPENISIAEDLVFLFLVFPEARKICFCKRTVYCYRITNKASAMHTILDQPEIKFQNHLAAAEIIIDSWKRNGYLTSTYKDIVLWMADFFKGPYERLDVKQKLSYKKRIDNIYDTLKVPESCRIVLCSSTSSSAEKQRSLLGRINLIIKDIQLLGVRGEIENLIYKIFFRRRESK